MTNYNALAKIFVKTKKTMDELRHEIKFLDDFPSIEDQKMRMELQTLQNIYNMILPIIHEEIENIIEEEVEGEFSFYGDSCEYSKHYRPLTDQEMKKIAEYLGFKYYYGCSSDFTYDSFFTNDEDELPRYHERWQNEEN